MWVLGEFILKELLKEVSIVVLGGNNVRIVHDAVCSFGSEHVSEYFASSQKNSNF